MSAIEEEDIAPPVRADESSTSSSEEEEDDNAKEWTEETEKCFLRTLSSLKKRDPKIYDENVCFFKEIKREKDNGTTGDTKKAEEKLYLRDYERKIILEKQGILTDEESDEDETKLNGCRSPTYVEEQKALKQKFKSFLEDDDENVEEGEEHCAGFLKLRTKTEQEQAKEDEDYLEWLKGQKDEIEDKDMQQELKYLRDYWTDPSLNEGEQFLRDYILNKRYLESDEEMEDKSELEFSEEEKILNDQEEYEQKYNFRFEEPDKEFIKTYPRVIESSLRRKNEKRKLKREALKKKKEQHLKEKQIEVKKLQRQKQQEFIDKIEKLKQITGNEQLGINDEDIEAEFDPEEHDKKMAQMFGDKFYEMEDEEKPVFSDIESDEEEFKDEEDVESIAEDDELVEEEEEQRAGNEEMHGETEVPTNGEMYGDETCAYNYEDVIMDCDYNPNAESLSKFKKQTRSSRKKGHKISKFMEDVRKEKPVFDPADKTYEEYLDEYYGLEFEDIIADIPCRFKYRKVIPNDFGLTVEEILAADDKELNKWCSMKKVDTIRQENVEKFEQKIYKRKAVDTELKKKILPSLFTQNQNENDGLEEQSSISIKKKKKKNRRSRKPKSLQDASGFESNSQETSKSDSEKRKGEFEKANSDKKKDELEKSEAEFNSKKGMVKSKSGSNKTKDDLEKSKPDLIKKKDELQKSKLEKKNDELEKSKADSNKKKDETEKLKANSIKRRDQIEAPRSISKKRKAGTETNACKRRKIQTPLAKSNVKNDSKRSNQVSLKTKNSKNSFHKPPEDDITDERLRAYGINPKRFRNKLKYGPKK